MNDHDQFRHVNLGAKTQNLGTKADVASNAARQRYYGANATGLADRENAGVRP